jgi:multiple sugar transport system permease protein
MRRNGIIVYFLLLVFFLCAVFPIYWMINTSLKTGKEIYSLVPTYFPNKLTFSAYVELFTKTNFVLHLGNSAWVAFSTAFGSIIVSMFAAYAIARLRFRGKKAVSRGIFFAYLMPKPIMYIPLYTVVAFFGLTDRLAGLQLIYPTLVIPYATWMLTSYFKSIPMSLEEAAIIDGCSRVGSMFKIVFPLSAPGIASTFIFAFTLCWGEYLYALVLINKDAIKTIAMGLADLIIDDVFKWGPLMGGAILASIPVILLYTIASKFVVSGMTAGGVKQ